MRYHFHVGFMAAETGCRICGMYSTGTLTKLVVQKWFEGFHAGNFEIKDA